MLFYAPDEKLKKSITPDIGSHIWNQNAHTLLVRVSCYPSGHTCIKSLKTRTHTPLSHPAMPHLRMEPEEIMQQVQKDICNRDTTHSCN